MEKLFAPNREKLDVIDAFMESMDVRMPTIAIIPNAIIITVNEVRNLWLFIDDRETLRFSIATIWFFIQDFVLLSFILVTLTFSGFFRGFFLVKLLLNCSC